MNKHSEPKFLNNDVEAAVSNVNPKSPKTGETKESLNKTQTTDIFLLPKP